jgi:hypothetical protein
MSLVDAKEVLDLHRLHPMASDGVRDFLISLFVISFARKSNSPINLEFLVMFSLSDHL